jgi:dienelactone hydrolase
LARRRWCVTVDVKYFGDFLLDVHVPAGEGPFRTVVTLHGAMGVKSQMTPLATVLAEDGYLVFNAQWLAQPPLDAAAAVRSFDAAACAVRFAAAHAGEYGGEASPLTVVGMSAGGLAGALASFGGDEFGDGCAASGEAAAVSLLVGLEGAYVGATERGGLAAAAEEAPELQERLDPRTCLNAEGPTQVVLFLGDEFAAAVAPAEAFAAALEQAGVSCELRRVSGPHLVPTFVEGVRGLLAE